MSEQARITRNEVKKKLRCDFTDDEELSLHGKLLGALNKQASLEKEKDVFNAGHKARLKPVEAEVETLRQQLNDGYDEREVECEEVFNFQAEPVEVPGLGVTVEPNCVTLIRLDTREIVGEPRPITDAERQRSFLGQYPEAQPAAEGEAGQEPEQDGEPERCRDIALAKTECGRCDDEECLSCCRGCQSQRTPCPERPAVCSVNAADGEDQPQEAA